MKPGVVAVTFNLRIQEADTGDLYESEASLVSNSEFQTNQGCIVRPCI